MFKSAVLLYKSADIKVKSLQFLIKCIDFNLLAHPNLKIGKNGNAPIHRWGFMFFFQKFMTLIHTSHIGYIGNANIIKLVTSMTHLNVCNYFNGNDHFDS